MTKLTNKEHAACVACSGIGFLPLDKDGDGTYRGLKECTDCVGTGIAACDDPSCCTPGELQDLLVGGKEEGA